MLAFFIIVAVLSITIAFTLTPRSWSLWHTGMHTEYAGTGRVWFISFFRGPGYVVRLRSGRGWDGKPLDAPGWRPNIYIPGFALYVRTARSSRSSSYGTPVRHVRLTRRCGAIV